VGKKLVSDDIREIAKRLFSVVNKIRLATATLASTANEIAAAESELASIADTVTVRENHGELLAQEKTKTLDAISAERERNERRAVKKYWTAKLNGERMTRQKAATTSELEKTALSKNGLPECMKKIGKAIEEAKANPDIQKSGNVERVRLLKVVKKVLNEFLKDRKKRKK